MHKALNSLCTWRNSKKCQNKDKDGDRDKSDHDSGKSRQVAFTALSANVSETNGESHI